MFFVTRADDKRTTHSVGPSEHHVSTATLTTGAADRRVFKFVAECTCGWRSEPFGTSGMASAAAGRHHDDAGSGGLA